MWNTPDRTHLRIFKTLMIVHLQWTTIRNMSPSLCVVPYYTLRAYVCISAGNNVVLHVRCT